MTLPRITFSIELSRAGLQRLEAGLASDSLRSDDPLRSIVSIVPEGSTDTPARSLASIGRQSGPPNIPRVSEEVRHDVDRLLGVFRVGQQLRGLTSRVAFAQKFFAAVSQHYAALQQIHSTIADRLRAVETEKSIADGAVRRAAEQIAAIHDRLRDVCDATSQSDCRREMDVAARTHATAIELLQAKAAGLATLQREFAEAGRQLALRKDFNDRALADIGLRRRDIAERFSELQSVELRLRAECPGDLLRELDAAVLRLGDDAMAAIEEIDRRNHEWSCGSCQMGIPANVASAVSMRHVQRCPACRCFLYIEQVITNSTKKVKKRRSQNAEERSPD